VAVRTVRREKAFLEQQNKALTSSEVIQLTTAIEGDVDVLRYKKVQVSGHYDQAHQFLIDNQISAGKAGYFVLTRLFCKEKPRRF